MTLLNGKNVSILLCVCIGFILVTSDTVTAEKEIPATKFGENAPTITFFYWYFSFYHIFGLFLILIFSA